MSRLAGSLRLLCALALLSVLLVSASQAATRYVKTGGTGGSNCSAGALGNELSTIRAAISCSGPGDIVYIRQGSYTEYLQNWDTNRPLTVWPVGTGWGPGQEVLIASAPGEQATLLRGIAIHNHYHSFNGQDPQYLIFDHLIISGGGNPNLNPEAPFESTAFFIGSASHIKVTNSDICCSNSPVMQPGAESSDITIAHNKIHDAYPSFNPDLTWSSCRNPDGSFFGCVLGNYCLYFSAKNSVLDHNEIYNCSVYAWQNYSGSCGASHPESCANNNTFSNNILHDLCPDVSRFFVPNQLPFACSGLTMSSGGNNRVYNNVIYNLGPFTSGGAIQESGFGGSYGSNYYYNNTIADSPTNGILLENSDDAIIRNNIIRNTGTAPILFNGVVNRPVFSNNLCSTAATGCAIVGNPNLASDFTLTAASTLAINAGFALPGIVDVDQAGVARPQPAGGAWDLGAYEYGGPPPATATQLAFSTPPTSAVAGVTLAPVVVQARTASGVVDPTFTGTVTLTRTIVSGSGTLSGTLSRAAMGGQATFSDLVLSAAGTYTLHAASAPLTAADSPAFTVSVGGVGIWGHVTPIADTAHPNLLYNQAEITAYRTQLLTNHQPPALWNSYVSLGVSSMLAIPTTGLSQSDLNEPWSTNYWAAFSYMMEPTLAKANAIRTMLLSFPSVFPAGHALDGDDWWQSHGWGFSAVPLAWAFDLILAYHPTVLSAAEISQLKAWFALAAQPQGADHFIDDAGFPHTWEGVTLGHYANWWTNYLLNNLPFALVAGDQTLVNYWADSGWPLTRFTYDGTTPPPTTANRFDLVMNILAILPSGANADSYDREGYAYGGDFTRWQTVNEGDYSLYMFAGIILSAEMAYHNGATSIFSGTPGAALLHSFQLSTRTIHHTDVSFGPQIGHPNLYQNPFMWLANRRFSADPEIAAGQSQIISSLANPWVSVLPRELYPFLGWPAPSIDPATQLVFSTPPTTAVAGATMAPVVVQAQSAAGALDTTFTGTVTLTRTVVSGSGTLSGTLSRPAVGGQATFSDLVLSAAGTYTLHAVSAPLTAADSPAFTVAFTVPPAAFQVEFGVQPSTALASAPIVPSITVRVESSAGALIPTATDSVTLALVSTQLPQSALTFVSADSTNAGWPGTNAIDNNTSTAWHTDFTVNPLGHPHNIVFSFPSTTVNGLVYTPRLGPDVSGQILGYNIYVSTDCATWGLPVGSGTFGRQAGGKRYGVSTTPKVGNCLKLESTSEISGSIYASAAEITILQASSVVPTGTLTQPASGGLATFAIAVPTAGSNYVLKATSGTLMPQMSLPFPITTLIPPLSTSTLVMAWDYTDVGQNGFDIFRCDTLVGGSDCVPTTSLGLTIGPTARQASDPSLANATRYCYGIRATHATMVPSAMSNLFCLDTPAGSAVAQLVYVAPPVSTITNAILTPVVLEARDGFGARVSSFAGPVTVALAGTTQVQIPSSQRLLLSVDTEETVSVYRPGLFAVDGDPLTSWITQYGDDTNPSPLPHLLTLDMQSVYNMTGLTYLPPQEQAPTVRAGTVTLYDVEVSLDNATWAPVVTGGTWANTTALKTATFMGRSARYIRLRSNGEAHGGQWMSAAEVNVLHTPTGGGMLNGTTIVNAISGRATFDTLSVSQAGSYSLQGSTPGVPPVVAPFTITDAPVPPGVPIVRRLGH